MKVAKVSGIVVAEKVLKELRALPSNAKDMFITTYRNGRESGFIVTNNNSESVAVTESRNGDEIVVYPVTGYDMITDQDYKDARYFSYNEFKKAAKEMKKIIHA